MELWGCEAHVSLDLPSFADNVFLCVPEIGIIPVHFATHNIHVCFHGERKKKS